LIASHHFFLSLTFSFCDSYNEVLERPSRMSAWGASLGALAAGALVAAREVHPLVRPLLPRPGEGPDREAQVGLKAANHLCTLAQSF
jgi:hypothetical protein